MSLCSAAVPLSLVVLAGMSDVSLLPSCIPRLRRRGALFHMHLMNMSDALHGASSRSFPCLVAGLLQVPVMEFLLHLLFFVPSTIRHSLCPIILDN